MSRKQPNPAKSLYQFMYGIYAYYINKGMPEKRAKIRMIDHTFEVCASVITKEEDLSDEMLVVMAKWFRWALNQRGASISEKIKNIKDTDKVIENRDALVEPLHEIKNAKDAIDDFIKTYKGWSDEIVEKEKS